MPPAIVFLIGWDFLQQGFLFTQGQNCAAAKKMIHTLELDNGSIQPLILWSQEL